MESAEHSLSGAAQWRRAAEGMDDWHLAIALVSAWRAENGGGDAVARRLAADGDPDVAERAVQGLAALGNTLAELYADRTGWSVDAVLREVALSDDDAPC